MSIISLLLVTFFSLTFSVEDSRIIDYCATGCTGFFDGCNFCTCPSKDGFRFPICTLRACTPKGFGDPYGSFAPFDCPEGCLKYQFGCQECECVSGGLRCATGCNRQCRVAERCTECESNKVFKSHSVCHNTCTEPTAEEDCELDGIISWCVCPDDTYWDSTLEKCVALNECTKCPPGQVLSFGSSYCTGGYAVPTCSDYENSACTDDWVEMCRVCDGLQIYDDLAGRCVDDVSQCSNRICPCGCSEWFDGCNTCFCDHFTGNHACTEIACKTLLPAKCTVENDMSMGKCGYSRGSQRSKNCICDINRELQCEDCSDEEICRCKGNRIWSFYHKRCIHPRRC